MDFKALLEQLQQTHTFMQNRAVSVVNQSHTLRNWLYGFYIVEYEQNGQDYAEYGSRLLYRISAELKKNGISGISYTNLTLYRKFYLCYPQIGLVVRAIVGIDTVDKSLMRNLQPLAEDFENVQVLPPELLLSKLSFTHFVELLKIEVVGAELRPRNAGPVAAFRSWLGKSEIERPVFGEAWVKR